MGKGARVFVGGLLTAVFAGSLVFSGCTRYANEQQISTLKEAQAASVASDQTLTQKEKEKADLQAQLQAKQDELKKAQAEQEKIKAKVK
jgi:outer membrane murein-binding lipoprotein Lpp